MKLKKFIALFLCLTMIILTFASCGGSKTPENPTDGSTSLDETALKEPESGSDGDKIKLSLLKGPTGMGGAYLWTKSDNNETRNAYDITLDTDASTVGPRLMTGEYDIASMPTNVAASLYQKSGGKIKVISVITLGVLYIVTKDNAISGLQDVKGKTILASGKGSIAEYALDYVLESNGLEVGKDVNIEFASEHTESVTKALAGGYDVVLLPEPFVSQIIAKDPSFSVAVDLTEEWEKIAGVTLAMGCFAVNTAYYENHKEEVAAFLEDYSESADYINANIDEGAKLIAEHDIMPEDVAKSAIPNSNIVSYTGDKMKDSLSKCFSVLLEQNPDIIGGKTPDDDFYVYA